MAVELWEGFVIIPLSAWQTNGIQVREDGGAVIDPVQVADPDENVVLDLHIGKVRYNPGPDAGQEIRDGSNIIIRPGAALRFETVESFTVGPKVFGQVCSRASLTNRGLIVANIKIDPMFQGKLAVTVYNVAPSAIKIPAGQHFCSVFFQQMVSEVKGNARTPPAPPSRSSSRTHDFWDRNRRFIVTGIVTLVLSVAGSIIATSVYDPHSTPTSPKSSSSSHP